MTVQKIDMPDGMPRPKTGPMQFGDDWPGVFIRGDNASGYAMAVEQAIEVMKENRDTFLTAAMLRGLAQVLRSK